MNTILKRRKGKGGKFYICKKDLKPLLRCRTLREVSKILCISPETARRIFKEAGLKHIRLTSKNLRVKTPCIDIKKCLTYGEVARHFGFKSNLTGKKIVESQLCAIPDWKKKARQSNRLPKKVWNSSRKRVLIRNADKPYQFTADQLGVSINNVVRAYVDLGIPKLNCAHQYKEVFAPQTIKNL